MLSGFGKNIASLVALGSSTLGMNTHAEKPLLEFPQVSQKVEKSTTKDAENTLKQLSARSNNSSVDTVSPEASEKFVSEIKGWFSRAKVMMGAAADQANETDSAYWLVHVDVFKRLLGESKQTAQIAEHLQERFASPETSADEKELIKKYLQAPTQKKINTELKSFANALTKIDENPGQDDFLRLSKMTSALKEIREELMGKEASHRHDIDHDPVLALLQALHSLSAKAYGGEFANAIPGKSSIEDMMVSIGILPSVDQEDPPQFYRAPNFDLLPPMPDQLKKDITDGNAKQADAVSERIPKPVWPPKSVQEQMQREKLEAEKAATLEKQKRRQEVFAAIGDGVSKDVEINPEAAKRFASQSLNYFQRMADFLENNLEDVADKSVVDMIHYDMAAQISGKNELSKELQAKMLEHLESGKLDEEYTNYLENYLLNSQESIAEQTKTIKEELEAINSKPTENVFQRVTKVTAALMKLVFLNVGEAQYKGYRDTPGVWPAFQISDRAKKIFGKKVVDKDPNYIDWEKEPFRNLLR